MAKNRNSTFFAAEGLKTQRKNSKCMSIIQGDVTVENAMGTYVQLFCGICKKYDCLMHGIKSVDSLTGYNVKTEENYPAYIPAQPCSPSCYMLNNRKPDPVVQPLEIIETIHLLQESATSNNKVNSTEPAAADESQIEKDDSVKVLSELEFDLLNKASTFKKIKPLNLHNDSCMICINTSRAKLPPYCTTRDSPAKTSANGSKNAKNALKVLLVSSRNLTKSLQKPQNRSDESTKSSFTTSYA